MLGIMNPYLVSAILVFLTMTLIASVFGIVGIDVASNHVAYGYESAHIQPVQAYCLTC